MVVAYCTDCDVAEETPDFRALCPPDDIDAYGTDGVIFPVNPWVLISESVDFESNKVVPGKVIYLRQDPYYGTDPGEAFAVHRVLPTDPHALELRRKSKATPGDGEPPGDRVATITGIEFDILTLQGMIEKASNEIDDRYNISGYLAARPGAVLTDQDLRILSDLTVYTVLERRYMAISKGTNIPGAKEVNSEKSRQYAMRRQEVEGKATLHFTSGERIGRDRRWKRIVK